VGDVAASVLLVAYISQSINLNATRLKQPPQTNRLLPPKIQHCNQNQYEALHACMDKNKAVFDALLAEMKAEEAARDGEAAAGGASPSSSSKGEGEGGGGGSGGVGSGGGAAAAAADVGGSGSGSDGGSGGSASLGRGG
jgi:hypothetical protein